MKIFVAHNYYQQPGGEDTVFAAETELLRRNGHEVIVYTESNERIKTMNIISKTWNTLWSSDTKQNIIGVLKRHRPEVAHFHNTFPLISPSAYYACKEADVPVIQSLHNPRLICPAARLYRDGKVCEDCIGKTPPWPGIIHGCYHTSVAHTSIVASMLTLHRLLKTWERVVDKYIVFTEFYRNKFIQGGIPSEKIVLKPHFVDPDPGCKKSENGEYALFIGRLDEEKGVRTMLKAWQQLSDIPLKIRGDGRLLEEVKDYKRKHSLESIEIVQRLNKGELYELIKESKFLVWPSEGYYETFGMVAAEAYACGVPVIASKTGILSENVEDGYTGLHFMPGDAEDLCAKVRWAWNNPESVSRMGKAARRVYENKYTPEINYKMLINIYEDTIEKNKRKKERLAI